MTMDDLRNEGSGPGPRASIAPEVSDAVVAYGEVDSAGVRLGGEKDGVVVREDSNPRPTVVFCALARLVQAERDIGVRVVVPGRREFIQPHAMNCSPGRESRRIVGDGSGIRRSTVATVDSGPARIGRLPWWPTSIDSREPPWHGAGQGWPVGPSLRAA
jgi:hypothetical protein